ncbi:MAG: competence protein TfoX [Desulfobulbaceae bacterium]|nr:MAG: competence protein TfoX [Desulfobulbaceae bacterium]
MAKKRVQLLSKQLRNVGPKLAEKLIEADIDTPDKLRALGAKEAFNSIYSQGDSYGDFNAAYLFALEGAIRDCDWLDIPEQLKTDYKKYAQELQKKKTNSK